MIDFHLVKAVLLIFIIYPTNVLLNIQAVLSKWNTNQWIAFSVSPQC